MGITGVDKLKMTAVLGVVKIVSAYLSAFFIVDILAEGRPCIWEFHQLASELYFAIFMNVVPEAQTTGNTWIGEENASRGALAAIFVWMWLDHGFQIRSSIS